MAQKERVEEYDEICTIICNGVCMYNQQMHTLSSVRALIKQKYSHILLNL